MGEPEATQPTGTWLFHFPGQQHTLLEGASWDGHAGTVSRGITSKSRPRGTWGRSHAVAALSVIGGVLELDQEGRGQKLLMRTRDEDG